MPLPQQVIDRLSNETQGTHNSSSGLLVFSIGILVFVVFVYFGITIGYEPYLNSQISTIQQKIVTAGKSISGDQQSSILNFYSEISNLQTLLKGHTVFSPFLSWLENNTEVNVYYSSIVFSSGNQVALTVDAKTQADLDQQLSIFESSPAISNITVSGISPLQSGTSSWQQANVVIFTNSSMFSGNNT